MSAVETGFKWAERWALTHWMFTSLGGGAMLGAILEIATGIPLELTIVFSAAISLAAMLVLSVINLLKAQARMADAKRLHYSRLHTETLNHRRARIAACRTIVSGWDGDHSHTAQRDKLLRDENFLAIRKHPVSYTHLTLPTICSV